MTDHVAFSRSLHPAPHRAQARLPTLFYGMFAAPVMWAGNFMVNYGLLSYACFPGDAPLPGGQPGLGYLWWLTLAFYVLTLCVCASGFVVSRRIWHATTKAGGGAADDVLDAGGLRTPYFALIGMAFSSLFFIATLAGLLLFAFERLCSG
jgi:hypothetical protein